MGSASNPQITVVNGDLTLSGNNTGYGILVVTGTLTFSGNNGWRGIVLVVGQGTHTGERRRQQRVRRRGSRSQDARRKRPTAGGARTADPELEWRRRQRRLLRQLLDQQRDFGADLQDSRLPGNFSVG